MVLREVYCYQAHKVLFLYCYIPVYFSTFFYCKSLNFIDLGRDMLVILKLIPYLMELVSLNVTNGHSNLGELNRCEAYNSEPDSTE